MLLFTGDVVVEGGLRMGRILVAARPVQRVGRASRVGGRVGPVVRFLLGGVAYVDSLRTARGVVVPALSCVRPGHRESWELFVAEGFDGVEAAGSAGGVETEEDADASGKQEGNQSGEGGEVILPAGAGREVVNESNQSE